MLDVGRWTLDVAVVGQALSRWLDLGWLPSLLVIRHSSFTVDPFPVESVAAGRKGKERKEKEEERIQFIKKREQ